MKTGLTKKQKTTDVYYNAKDPLAEVYTHDTNLKKRLRKYAAKYPELCKQTDDDGQGGLRFEIDKSRISIRLTAPYSDDRRKAASELAKRRGIHTKPYLKRDTSNASQFGQCYLNLFHCPVWAAVIICCK